MKNLKRLFVLLFALVLVLPFSVYAKKDSKKEEKKVVSAAEKYSKYNHTNLAETLETEGIELENKDYTENDKQITIYLFRGQGCTHCQEFLTFLSSLTKEYGEYFKLVAFETWQDSANKELMDSVAEQLGTEAGGVPFIVIGDKVFPGYASTYDDQIKDAIMNLYSTPEASRYDIFTNVKEPENHDLVVGIITVLLVGGLVATAVITRKNNG